MQNKRVTLTIVSSRKELNNLIFKIISRKPLNVKTFLKSCIVRLFFSLNPRGTSCFSSAQAITRSGPRTTVCSLKGVKKKTAHSFLYNFLFLTQFA